MTTELRAGSPDISVERDVPVPMADGVRLYADLYRPSSPGPHHVLLISQPYDKGPALSNVALRAPVLVRAPRLHRRLSGHAAAGFGRRETSTRSVHEADDVSTTIEWAGRLPGSTGKVATYGFSYPGLDQLLAAQRKPRGSPPSRPGSPEAGRTRTGST